MDESFHLPTSTVAGSVLAPRWGPNNLLLVHERRPVLSDQQQSLGFEKKPSLHELKWKYDILEEPASRSMVSESATLFAELQWRQNSSEPLTQADVVRGSRRYRSVIHAAIERLDEQPIKKVLQEVEISWHLCEILFVDFQPPGVLLTQLLSWIRWHFPETSSKSLDVANHKTPHEHPQYWEVITSFLIRGENEHARIFLGLHSDSSKREEFSMVKDLIRTMPVYNVKQLSHEFDMRWQSWSEECNSCLQSGIFDQHVQLKNIVRILAGDESVLLELRPEGCTWFQLMVARLLFKDPFIKEHDLAALSQECASEYLFQSEPSTFDKVLLAAFSYDLMEVLREGCYFNDNWWFVAHFVDLFYNGNQLANHQVEDEARLREFLVLDYAESLMGHSSLWQVGATYHDACNDAGRLRLQLLIERVPVENNSKARKLIAAAEKRNLFSVSRSISKAIAHSWINKKRYSQALVWAVKSQDPSLCTFIADYFLQEYSLTGSFPDTDVLSSLGRAMLISERLTFLGKYFEFQQLHKDGQLEEAGDLLISLISSRISPKSFILTLLMDSLPLLEADVLVLNSDKTFQILVSLEELLDSQVDFETDRENAKDIHEKERSLRLAVAKNISRALVA